MLHSSFSFISGAVNTCVSRGAGGCWQNWAAGFHHFIIIIHFWTHDSASRDERMELLNRACLIFFLLLHVVWPHDAFHVVTKTNLIISLLLFVQRLLHVSLPALFLPLFHSTWWLTFHCRLFFSDIPRIPDTSHPPLESSKFLPSDVSVGLFHGRDYCIC